MPNRPIKFRAWIDGDHKGSANWPTLAATKLMEYGVCLSTEGTYLWIDKREDVKGHYPSVPLMQFTGLLDRNGKEIYEGDIITCLDEDDNELIMEVFYQVDEARWIPLNSFRKFEIIGNIYENPGLLTHE